MFHRAEPEEPGFGVMISTPGFTMSSQVWMLSGLPLRTTKTTTDDVAMPLVGVVLPGLVDEAGVHEAGHVGLEREVHDVGVEAAVDGTALVTGGAVRRAELRVLAGLGVLEVREHRLVGRLEHRVADDADRVGRRGARAAAEHAVKASTPAAAAATAALIFIFMSSLSRPADRGFLVNVGNATRL